MKHWRYMLCAPGMSANEEAAALDCLRSGGLASWAHVEAYEKAFARVHRTRHAIAVANGTAAIHLALLAAGAGSSPDDEVIQPSLNLVGTANMTVAAGARPAFADIVALNEPTIDPEDVARLIGPNTRAVVALHYGGYPARMADLQALCRAHKVMLIEDASLGPGYVAPDLNHRALGTLGDIGCYSVCTNNTLNSGEGGMVVTDDDALAARMRALLETDTGTLGPDCGSGRILASHIMAHGFSYRMDPLRAALGLAQLETAAAAMEMRQRRAQAYANVVESFCDGMIDHVFGWAPREGAALLAAILVEPHLRDGLRTFLAEKRIQTSRHYPPVHCFDAFTESRSEGLPRTLEFAERVITLPLHAELPAMAPEHIIRFCTTFLSRETASAALQAGA
ncbi:MAG: DegT/DnrJ/EryC1/StrS aminotransferase family protein [Pseudomonadota bacterium]